MGKHRRTWKKMWKYRWIKRRHGRVFFEDIFKYRPRQANKNISTFLGDLKDHPEVLAKKLTELDEIEADKPITTEELKETLDNSNAGKTPGPENKS